MGNKISTNEPRTISYISVVKDPTGETGFGIDLASEELSENDLTEKLVKNKSRLAVRHNEDTVAQVGVVSQGNTSYTMDINQLPFPTIVCDTNFQIIVVNSSLHEFTELPATTYIGKSFLEFVQEDHTANLLSLKDQAMLSGKDTTETEIYLSASGQLSKCVLVKCKTIRDHSGIPKQFLLQLVDLSHRNATEERLRKKSEELERFVYSTSHDLRAPLRSILGLIYIIQQETDQDAIRTYLEMIRSSVNRMDNFIKEIVDLSRNSRQPINTEEIDLKEVVTDIFDSLRFIPGAEKIDFILTIKQARPFVSDISRIKVVLNNLISNAIAYHRMQQEHPFIEVRINVTNKYCYIEVIDNGRGIQQEHQTKIFDMFYRASDDAKGSGLGLYIVKEAVQKLNGEIRIKSTWGEGTTFSLKFFNHTL
jgi:PAS domain S-box-containing protein